FEARGLQHRREVLVSAPAQCLAVRLSGDLPGRISLRVGLASDQPSARVIADANDAGLLLQGENVSAHGVEGRLRFCARLRVLPIGGTLQRRGEDRKSTRLNSSHVKISYAVFCL